MKRNFKFSAKFLKEIDALPESKKLEAFQMIVDYGLKGKKPEAFSDESLNAAWSRILPMFKEEDAKESKIPENMFESDEEKNFDGFIQDTYPLLNRFDYPLTLNQYKMLKSDFDKGDLDDAISALANMRGSNKKYSSVYLTLRNWLRRNVEQRQTAQAK